MAENELREFVKNFLAQFSGQRSILTIPRVYIDITGNLEAALLFSQIIYWSDRAKDGWFAKSYGEWLDEIYLSEYQVRKAVKLLAPLGVTTKLKKFNGAPTVHYHFNNAKFSEFIPKFFKNGKQSNFGNQDTEKTQETITETTETTSKAFTSSDVAAMIEAWLKATGSLDKKAYSKTGYRTIAETLLTSGYTPKDLCEYITHLKTNDKYYATRTPSWGYIQDNITAWKPLNGATNGHVPDVEISPTVIDTGYETESFDD